MSGRDPKSGQFAKRDPQTGDLVTVQRAAGVEETRQRIARFRRIRNALINDRGGDPTKAQMILAENAAGLCIFCEEQVAALVEGRAVEIGELQTTMNTLRRLLETLGIERQPKDITTLSQYLEQHAKQQTINGDASHEH